MNILVIGNGFDLAHGLPTTYQDFLRFTDKCAQYLDPRKFEQVWEIKKLVEDNTWLKHFREFYDLNGWIGFESEISNVIQVIERKIPEFERIKENGKGGVKFNLKERELLKEFDQNVTQGIIFDVNFISENKNHMLKDLNNLIRCMEIYLEYFVNRLQVNWISPDIEDLDIQKVLSFNYTDTYARIYDTNENNNIEYDYIHGKANASNNIENNNMVLGIDEYLPDDRKDKDIEFIAFKKYYQRIYKQTGCKYKEWVDAIKDDYSDYLHEFENVGYMEQKNTSDNMQKMINRIAKSATEDKKCLMHNLYIFGHSLDITDRDIIRDLILNDNVYTTIFYPNKKELGRKIANLVKVIGQDELIRRTGGSTKTIEFKLQQEMELRESP